MDVRAYNRDAWNKAVERSDPWTLPANEGVIAEARTGKWSVRLTPTRHVPPEWFPDLQGIKVLGLAAGGGQQGPIFAAAGADVTILDNSPKQLQQDRMVAEREGLAICLIEGDMKNLEMLPSGYFDLVFNPISTCFVDDVLPVGRRPGIIKGSATVFPGELDRRLPGRDEDVQNESAPHGSPRGDSMDRPGGARFRTWAVTRSTLFPRTSTDVVTRLMRKVLGRSDVAAHSFKRSTLGIMLLAAHKGLIPMRLVAQMGKHLGLDPLFPDTTVGYIGNRVLLAETNHSALATPLLDPTHPFGASTTEVDHLKD